MGTGQELPGQAGRTMGPVGEQGGLSAGDRSWESPWAGGQLRSKQPEAARAGLSWRRATRGHRGQQPSLAKTGQAPVLAFGGKAEDRGQGGRRPRRPCTDGGRANWSWMISAGGDVTKRVCGARVGTCVRELRTQAMRRPRSTQVLSRDGIEAGQQAGQGTWLSDTSPPYGRMRGQTGPGFSSETRMTVGGGGAGTRPVGRPGLPPRPGV